MWVWHKGKISVSTLPRTTVGAHTHTAAMNQMPSHLKRPGTIYFSFSSYCWHTVIAGSRCLATKSGQAFFQSSVREKLRPSPSPEEWLKGHFTPRLVSEQRLSFLKTIKRVCVCVRLWERVRGRTLECWCKTFGDEWAEQQLHRPGDRSCKGGGYVARSISRHLPHRTLNVTLSDCSIVILQ